MAIGGEGVSSERFEMRFDAPLVERLDRWRQGDGTSREEAVRRLVEEGLEGARRELSISDGERLLLAMVADIHKASVRVEGEADPGFILSALCGGHDWGLEWQYGGLFPGRVDRPEVVAEVVDILEMWSQVEWSLARLSAESRARVEAEEGLGRSQIRFLGFDGNEESEHFSVASFMIGELGRFTCFKDRDLNSHHPVLNGYRRQVEAFAPIRARSPGEPLQAEDLIEILRDR